LFLKRLEIQGFKSFADRTVLEFGPGITCIVGPNGCGKSNIVDAIRWVLGEQGPKSLRGFRMEDVIFSGSERRRPVGMAEVTITLDNSTKILPLEYSEVSVSRKLFRSGDSEYLINKTPCRLRDVHELFLDTGVGKDAFSLVGQGQVETVLNAKPEERRSMIEEAAGVVRYRHRKREAVRKLEETEGNLVRLEDILHELSGRLEPLSRQAETAERYLKWKEELDRLEIGLMLAEYERQQRRLRDLQKTRDRLQEKYDSRQAVVDLSAAALEEKRLALKDGEEKLNGRKQQIFELTRELERCQSRVELARQQQKTTKERRVRLVEETRSWQAKLDSLLLEYRTEEADVDELAEAVARKQAAVSAGEEELALLETQISSARQEAESLKAALIDLLNQIASNNNLLASNRTGLELSRQRLMSLKDTIGQLEDSRLLLEKEAAALEEKVAATSRNLEKLAQDREKAEQNLEKIGLRLESQRQKVRRAEDRLQVLGSRHEALQEMLLAYDGYNQGVRFVMQKIRAGDRKMDGVLGVVADLISVPPRFEEAIEVALGGAVQYLVTKTDEDAKRVINQLNTSNGGRATFLPLNMVRPPKRLEDTEKAAGFPGFLGEAARLIKYLPELEKVVQYLLGGVLVSEDLEAALLLARRLQFRFRVVTLGGDLISTGGALTGGRFSRKTSFLGRKRELDTLARQIEETRLALDRLREEETRLEAERETAGEQLANLHKEYQEGQIIYGGLEKDLKQGQAEVLRVNQQLELLALEVAGVEAEISRLSSAETELSTDLARLQDENRHLEETLAGIQQQIRDLEDKKSRLLQNTTDSRVALASARQQHQDRIRGLEKYYQTRDAYEQEIASRRKNKIRGNRADNDQIHVRRRHAGTGQSLFRCLDTKIRCCGFRIGNMTFPDAAPGHNPLVTCVHHFFQFGIGQHSFRESRPSANNPCCSYCIHSCFSLSFIPVLPRYSGCPSLFPFSLSFSASSATTPFRAHSQAASTAFLIAAALELP
jgi:chromosome segregation protein